MSKKVFHAHGNRFIDPIDCGSTVAWVVDVTVREPDPKNEDDWRRKGIVTMSASVTLSDCVKRIEWEMSGRRTRQVKKLDEAISELKALRAALVSADKIVAIKRKEFGLPPIETEDDDD